MLEGVVYRLGVSNRFVRMALGAVGVAAAYHYQLPAGLLGLLLIASGLAGWCSICTGGVRDREAPAPGRVTP